MLDNFSNVRKIPILSHHLLISGKSFTDFTGVNISLMVIFLYQPLFNVIFIVLIKCHIWKKVSCFFMVFYLKLLFEAVQYWTVLYFSFEKDTPTWVMPELYLPHNLLSAFFYKYPWKHIQHKRILDSQCLILGKYCRNIYFFSFWMQGIFWAMVSVLSFATNFCLKFASGRFCMWIHSQTCTLADFHVQTKLSSFPFQSVPWKHKALSA